MRGIGMGKGILWTCGLAGAALAQPATTLAQSAPNTRPTTAQENTPQMDPASVGKLLQQLQSQVQELSGQVKSLKADNSPRTPSPRSYAKNWMPRNGSLWRCPPNRVELPLANWRPPAERRRRLRPKNESLAWKKISNWPMGRLRNKARRK